MNRKRLIFWTTFLGGAGVVAVLPEFTGKTGEPAIVAVAPRPASPTEAPKPAPQPAPLASLRAVSAPLAAEAAVPAASAASAARPELFAAKSWHRPPPPPPPAPPPPPPPPAPPPPPPAAPPLPFSFMGRLDDGKPKVFLQRGEKLYAVSVGDTIEGQYRLERIDATQLLLVYLPLNLPQILTIGKS